MEKLSCIVPMYNEQERPLEVLKTLSRCEYFSQIICVDDGSENDASIRLITKYFPRVEVVKLTKNLGKCEAVKAGLKQVKNKYIFLIDADATNIDPEKLRKIIEYFFNRMQFKSAILVNPNTHMIEKIFKGNLIMAGARIVRREDLDNTFRIINPVRYQLEIALNKYLIEKKLEIAMFDFPMYLPHKSKKWGLLNGWFKDIQMQLNILNFGFSDWFKQYLYFSNQKIVYL
jgi:glycosyltransferase involved in cell wall biosynthesis